MTTPSLPLEDLAHHIAQQESELERLRREYEARRAHLDELGRRKQDLEAQLHQVDAEIEDINRGAPEAPPAAPREPASAAARRRRGQGVKFTDLIVDLVRQGGGQPVTVKELSVGVVRSKFPTTSGNIPRLVQTRVGEMVRKGVLRRAGDQPGVVLGGPSAATSRRQKSPARGKAKKPAGRGRTAPKAAAPARGEQRPLRVVLMDILKKSRQPLGSGQLAEKVLATGYRTNSGDFAGVVSVALTKLPELENVPGKGYRLKKR
jgi:hypothetical protein